MEGVPPWPPSVPGPAEMLRPGLPPEPGWPHGREQAWLVLCSRSSPVGAELVGDEVGGVQRRVRPGGVRPPRTSVCLGVIHTHTHALHGQ